MWRIILLLLTFQDSFAAAEDANAVDVCPAEPGNTRTVACTLPSGATNQTECESVSVNTQAACCWDDTSTVSCRASDALRCSLSDINSGSDAKTATTIGGVAYSAVTESDYNMVYPGETVTFTCTDDNLFTGDDSVDSDTQTEITCAVDEDGNVTDINTYYSDIQCQSPCTSVNYDPDTQYLTPNVSSDNPQRYGSTYTYTCNDGYGMANSGTEKTGKCKNLGGAVDQCYRCDVPTDADLKVGGSFSAESTVPLESVDYTCNYGYSISGTSDKQLTSTCGTDGFETDFTECIADCSLTLVSNVTYAHTVTDSDVTTHLSVGSTITIGCTNGALPVSQSDVLTCSTAGDEIVPEACQPQCEVDSLTADGTNRDLDYKLTSSAEYGTIGSLSEVNYGTLLNMTCSSTSGYSIQYSDQGKTEFNCSDAYYDSSSSTWTGVPTCWETCTLSSQSSTDMYGSITVIVGDTSRSVSWDDSVAHATQISIDCQDPNDNVKGTSSTTQTLTCDDGSSLSPQPCIESCEIANLPSVTDNTIVSPTDRVGLTQNVAFSCPSNYLLGTDAGSFTEESSTVECEYVNATLEGPVQFNYLSSASIPTQSQCYAYPTIKSAVPNGAGKIDFEVEFDSDRDTSVAIQSLTVTTTYDSTDDSCTTGTSGASFTCTVDTSTNEATARSATATVVYDTVYTDGTDYITYTSEALGSLYPGPSALDSSDATVSVVGKDTLTIVLSAATISAAQAIQDSADSDYSITYTVDIYSTDSSKRRSVSLVKTFSDLPLSTFDSPGVSLDISSLSTITSYSIEITSILTVTGGISGTGGNVGGLSFSTGYEMPIVTDSVTHSTTNVFTITLGGGALYTGDLNVSIDGESYSISFTNGTGTQDLTDLTAMQAYTYDVIVYSADSVPSPTTQISFTQGPTEPVLSSSPTLTNAAATVTWERADQNIYYLNLYLKTDDSYSDTAAESYTVGINDTASHTFADLTAGATYKVTAVAEMEVDGTTLQSAAVELQFTLYSCATSDKLGAYLLEDSAGDAVEEGVYLVADTNEVFYVSCATVDDKEYDFESSLDETVDNITACIGPDEWASHSDCAEVTDAISDTSGSSAGVVVGIVIVCILILVIIIIIIILIKRRKSTETSSSTKKYSPRDEEKNNETDQEKPVDTEDHVIVVPDNDTPAKESPDIPDNRDVSANANGGDNVSQEARVDFDDEDEHQYDEAPGVVIANNSAEPVEEKENI